MLCLFKYANFEGGQSEFKSTVNSVPSNASPSGYGVSLCFCLGLGSNVWFCRVSLRGHHVMSEPGILRYVPCR